MPKLQIITASQGEETHDVRGDVLTIGRAADNTIQIKEPSVSQHHARLSLRAGTYVVEDLGSTNRTFHNGTPVMEKELESTCILMFGTVEAIFKIEPSDRPGTQNAQFERQIETLRQARDLANHRNAKLAKEREDLVAERDEARAEVDDLKARLTKLESAPAQPGDGEDAKRLEATSNQVRELEGSLAAAQRECDAVRKQADQLREDRDQLQDKIAKSAQDLHDAKGRLDQLAKQSEATVVAGRAELEERIEEQRKQIVFLIQQQKQTEAARTEAEQRAASTAERLAGLERESGSASDDLRKQLEERVAEVAALAAERDRIRQAVEAVTKERDESRAASADADELRKRIENLDGERQRLEGEFAERLRAAEETHSELNGRLSAATGQLEDARQQRERIAKEKDALAAELEAERRNAHEAREAALAELRAELDKVRNEARETTADRDATRLQKEMLSDELDKAHAEVRTAQADRAEAVAARESAESEIGEVRTARDGFSAQLGDAQAKLETLGALETEKASLAGELASLKEEFEALRKNTGELLARISNGGDPNAAVDAFTDKVPDFKRFVGSNFRRTGEEPDHEDELFVPDPPAKPESAGPVVVSERIGNWLGLKHNAARRPAPAPAAKTSNEIDALDRANIGKIPDLLARMRRDLQYLIRHKNDKKVLHELFSNANSVTANSGSTQFHALHEMAQALENLIRSLHETPERVEQSTLRTVSQSIDFLGILLEPANLERTRTLEPASVLAVDDDPEVLDAVLSSMEQVNLQSTGVAEPGQCLEMIGKQRYDLLLLDIRLPEITGWDVCSKVREMPGYAKTPIVFLTGMATIENKVQSTFRGGNDFIAKPFNVRELGIKALIWVYRGKLELL